MVFLREIPILDMLFPSIKLTSSHIKSVTLADRVLKR